jgi:translation initiation factor 4E
MSETKKNKKDKQKNNKEKEKEQTPTDTTEQKDLTKKEPEIKITISSSPSLRPLAPEFKPSGKKVDDSEPKKEEKNEERQETNTKVSRCDHPLETPWTFYFDKKLAKATIDFHDFQQNLHKLGSFNTIEGFWRMYCHLSSPELIPKDCDLFLFRSSYVPAWESFPNGGCWIIKVRKRNGVINRLWEELLFASVGEQFDEPDLVGIELSTRGREDMLSVWNRDNTNTNIRFRIGERLKEILNLDESTQIEYKYFSHSLRDGSTFRNAKAYVYAATHSANNRDKISGW